MKKLIAIIALAAAAGCNQQIFDLEFKFSKAHVRFPDGHCETINLKKWRDYEGEQIQIVAQDGRVLVFNSMNIVLER